MASANPATVPVSSAAGPTRTANAVPLVPRLIARSPGRSPSPSAAAMLSPVPGPTTHPASGQMPATAAGLSTSGSMASQSRVSSTSSRRSVR